MSVAPPVTKYNHTTLELGEVSTDVLLLKNRHQLEDEFRGNTLNVKVFRQRLVVAVAGESIDFTQERSEVARL